MKISEKVINRKFVLLSVLLSVAIIADDNAYLVCAWCEKIGSSSASFPIFSGGLDCAEIEQSL